MRGNKGEWSEIYALLKLISDRQLFAGNDNFERIENLIYPIISIVRDADSESHNFSFVKSLVLIKNEKNTYRIPVEEFKKQVEILLQILIGKTERTFEVPTVEEFLKSFNCISLKAKSSKKSDIFIKINDIRSGTAPQLGFSIKSQFGSASTLFNAGLPTNFVYEIKGVAFSESEIEAINKIVVPPKIKSRIERIEELGGKFKWVGIANEIFYNNMALIDSALPLITGHILFKYYSSGYSKMSDLLKVVTASNPLKFNLSYGHPYYTYKIKRFLTDIALGLMATKVWKGQLDATGGYLIVKKDGEVLCYHIYNRNEFEEYLVANTKFETASLSRHKFGKLYKEDGKYFMKLNLQIRFIK